MSPSIMEHLTLGGVGRATVGTSEAGLPAASAKYVKIRALAGNANTVYFGSPGVTAATGFALAAGEDSGWIPVSDVGDLAVIAGAADQGVSLIWLK